MTRLERVGFVGGIIAICLSILSVVLAMSRDTDAATVVAAAGFTAVVGAMCIFWSLEPSCKSGE